MYDKVDNLNTKNQKIKAIKSQINMYKDKDILNVSQADKDLLIFSKKRTYTSKFHDSGQISTKIYDKRDDFNFKIIYFPNMCSNIPASPAYGVYISQLIRYTRASSNYSDFLKRHLHLRNRLLDQGY